MDVTNYIESGDLELYVAGLLSEKENLEVHDLMLQHPEISKEVEEIEAAIVKLTASTSSLNGLTLWRKIQERLRFNTPSKDIKTISVAKPKYNWLTYTGWAAAILLGIGFFWLLNQNNVLEDNLKTVEAENIELETQIADAKNDLEAKRDLLRILRSRDIIIVPLGGQGDFASTYAKVYWDKNNESIHLDAQGLPAPPPGKVYQVWSLTLDPLTPVSLGTIDTFMQDDNKIFEIQNLNESEAFGITLEPTGGSPTPTMEQLYTLGVVEKTS